MMRKGIDMCEPDDFAVEWDAPRDTELTWRLEAGPETPLTQSREFYWYQGWSRAARERGAGDTVPRRIYVNGYAYGARERIGLGNAEEQDRARRAAERRTPRQWQEDWLPYIQDYWRRFRAMDLGQLYAEELASFLQHALVWYSECGRIHAHMGWTTIDAVDRLVSWYQTRFGGEESEAYKLLQGQANLSTAKGHCLWALSQQVTPPVAARLRAKEWGRLPQDFRRALNAYVEDYWDDRHRAAQMLLLYKTCKAPDPLIAVARLAVERQEFTEQVRGELAADARREFDDLLTVALANNPLTEDHNYWLDRRASSILRPIYKEIGKRLVQGGVLKKWADVEFLRLEELMLWGFGVRDPLRPRMAKRRAEHARYKRLQAPDFIGPAPLPAKAGDGAVVGGSAD